MTKGLPKIDEDTMPGELANVVAGRVANLLDFKVQIILLTLLVRHLWQRLDACRLLQLRQVDLQLQGQAIGQWIQQDILNLAQ